MPIGIGKTTAGLGGAVPQVNLTGMTRNVQKRLFFSRRESALLMEKTLRGGFGAVDIGTIMGVVAGDDRIVPHAAVGSESAIGKTFLVANAANGQATLQVDLVESYRFIPGDPVVLYNGSAAGVYMVSTVNAVDRTGRTAVVTLDDDFAAATFTTANGAFICHRTGENAADATSLAAAYVLDQDMLTGVGEDTVQPDGALGSIVVSNAILYQDVMENVDDAVLTALSLIPDGRFYILR